MPLLEQGLHLLLLLVIRVALLRHTQLQQLMLTEQAPPLLRLGQSLPYHRSSRRFFHRSFRSFRRSFHRSSHSSHSSRRFFHRISHSSRRFFHTLPAYQADIVALQIAVGHVAAGHALSSITAVMFAVVTTKERYESKKLLPEFRRR